MVRIGILGCADIAYRRFMPATKKIENIQVVAVAEEYDRRKLPLFCEEYGIEAVNTFEELINRSDIEAIYVPQPPALHYKWAKEALLAGKHVLVEKPATIKFNLTNELVELAKEKQLVLHENYMFQYHNQIKEIMKLIQEGIVGEVRLYKANFGFPMRAQNDFRYNRELGGGALLDAGGYAIKLATLLLGETVQVDSACLNTISGYDVDIYGNASLSNAEGEVCQIGFGMDCFYQCSLEVWGSRGRLFTNRIFTAPEGYEPTVIVENADGCKEIKLGADSHFANSLHVFTEAISSDDIRRKLYKQIVVQARLVEDVYNKDTTRGEDI